MLQPPPSTPSPRAPFNSPERWEGCRRESFVRFLTFRSAFYRRVMTTSSDLTTKSNPRAASVRIAGLSRCRARRQFTHDQRRGPQPKYVDSARTHLNRVLIEPRSIRDITAEVEVLRQAAGRKRCLRADAAVVTAGIVTLGIEAQNFFAGQVIAVQDAMIRAAVTAVAERLHTTVESLVIHCDESAPHAHFALRAVTHDGMPVSKIVDRSVTSELQDILFETFGLYLPGIERGNRKIDRISAGANPSETINRTVRELHLDLPIERDLLLEENNALHAENAALWAEHAVLRDEKEALAAAKRNLSAEVEEKQRELADLGKRNEIARGEASDAKQRITAAQAVVQLQQKALKALKSEGQRERDAQARDRDRANNLAREHDSLRLGIEKCIDGTFKIAFEVDGTAHIVWGQNRMNRAQWAAIKPQITPGLRLLLPLIASVCQIPVGGMLGHDGEHAGRGFQPGNK
ncbi:MAG: plasmid recombination protein [Aurantimonas coralicida]